MNDPNTIQKVNLRARKRPVLLQAEPKTYECPRTGDKFVFYWRALDPFAKEAANVRANELEALYVTGGFNHPQDGHWCVEPLQFELIDGRPVIMTRAVCLYMARIEALQQPPNVESKYTADDIPFIALTAPEVWSQVQEDANLYWGDMEGWEKKDSGATGAAPQEPVSVSDCPLPTFTPTSSDSSDPSRGLHILSDEELDQIRRKELA